MTGVRRVIVAVKQRLQMYNSPYHNSFDCLRRVLRTEGLPALYRAYFTQLSTNVPFQCIHFMSYEFLQKRLNPRHEYLPWTHMVSGGLAGSFAAAFTTPMDVCKTILNVQVILSFESIPFINLMYPDAIALLSANVEAVLYALNSVDRCAKLISLRINATAPRGTAPHQSGWCTPEGG